MEYFFSDFWKVTSTKAGANSRKKAGSFKIRNGYYFPAKLTWYVAMENLIRVGRLSAQPPKSHSNELNIISSALKCYLGFFYIAIPFRITLLRDNHWFIVIR